MTPVGPLTPTFATVWPAAAAVGSRFLKFPEWLCAAIGSTRAIPYGNNESTASPQLTDVDISQLTTEPMSSLAGLEPPSLVDTMLTQRRYALLLRPQLIVSLTAEQVASPRAALADAMWFVPEGPGAVRCGEGRSNTRADLAVVREIPYQIEAFYLDRCAVTNAEFHAFVSHGGYEQMAIWDQQILPAILDFVDRTGHPGPRDWRHGRFARGQEQHPVVGVSWYEASAYARWVGKRLPTDAEWVKAASWPVAVAGHPIVQRPFPWGDAMDRSRANLWGSGPGGTVVVDQFPSGMSIAGVQQLIGNVWEWTADTFALAAHAERQDTDQPRMNSLRGGAFDTYLDHQASCDFRSGDLALARKHNIGFRCAICVRDVSPRASAPCENRVETNPSDTVRIAALETQS